MKKLILLILITFTAILSYSQYCNTATTNVTITPTTTVQYSATYISTNRPAFNFVATAGSEYTFSTVGQSTVDTYLRLYSTGTGGALLAESDDYNNTQSEITWYCSTSGTYSVLLTRWSSTNTCNTLNANARIKYQKGSSGGTVVSIGGGEVSDYNVPANHYYKYGWTDMIYLQSEINTVGNITKIRFQVDPVTSIPYTATNQKIYMGHTTLSAFPSSTVKENAQTNYISSNYTLVYNGTINWTVGWVEIVLQTPFPWNNTNNLLIKWENRNNAYTFDEPWFYYTTKTNTVAYKVLDASYPTADGVRGSLRPNIKIALGDPVSLPISLVYFEGRNTIDGNLLEWQTATEADNDYFTLERGVYANGSVDWQVIKYERGAGNSTIEHTYGIYDWDYADDINYYRLTQTDYNGKNEIFDIISIDNRIKTNLIIRAYNLLGQPVPLDTPGQIIIQLEDGTYQKKFN